MENERPEMKTTGGSPEREGGRMDRIADQTKGLFEDVKEWIDLKVQLVQLDLEEKFETIANQLLSALLVVVLAFMTLMFGLVAASLALGKVFGDPLWGFLATTAALAVITVIIRVVKPRMIRASWSERSEEQKETETTPALPAQRPIGQLPEPATDAASHEESKQEDGSGA